MDVKDLSFSERDCLTIYHEQHGCCCWYPIGGWDVWYEVNFNKDEYPSMNCGPQEMSAAALAEHVNTNCQGWTVLNNPFDDVVLNFDEESGDTIAFDGD